MTNPVAAPAPAQVPGAAAPVAPGAAAPVPAPTPAVPVDPNAPAPVEGEPQGDGSDDQALLAMQMNARFSVVKQSGAGEEEKPAPAATPAPAAAVPPAAPAPVPTVPSTSG